MRLENIEIDNITVLMVWTSPTIRWIYYTKCLLYIFFIFAKGVQKQWLFVDRTLGFLVCVTSFKNSFTLWNWKKPINWTKNITNKLFQERKGTVECTKGLRTWIILIASEWIRLVARQLGSQGNYKKIKNFAPKV